jgi:hypothetical protein
MSTIPPLPTAKSETEKSLEAQKSAAFNPANPGGVAAEPPRRRRIPLSIPRRKLEVDPIPGFVLYWFKESNIPIALEAGYEFVEQGEVRLMSINQANPSDSSGSTDLGSRVSIVGDAIGQRGVPERLVLMKIREEFWREDRSILDNENAKVIQAIFGGQIMAREQGDHSQSYVNTAIAHGSGRLLNRGLKKQT